MDFFKKVLRRDNNLPAPTEARAHWEADPSNPALVRALAAAFVASYKAASAAQVESGFGPTSAFCNACCVLLAAQTLDVTDPSAEASRNATRVSKVLEDEALLMQALQLCARHEGNVVAFVQSGVCAQLIRFLESCLEAAAGVADRAGAGLTLSLFEVLLACPAFCDAMAGSPLLFLLFTLPVREALPHNSAFCLACARVVAASVPHWGPAVLASLADAGWVGFVMARIDSDVSQVSDELKLAVATMLCPVLQQSARGDGQLFRAFSQQSGYEHLASMMRRMAATPKRRLRALELMAVLARLVYVGQKPLKAPEENPFLLKSALDIAAAEASTDRRRSVTGGASSPPPPPASAPPAALAAADESKRVRNPEAVAALQRFCVSCIDPEVQSKGIDVCFSIFAAHPQNYLLLQQQHTFAEFIEHFDAMTPAVRKNVLGHLVAIEEELHFVPFHELMNLSLLLDRSPSLEMVQLVQQTVRRLVERNALYKSYFEQAGLLHIAGKLLRDASSGAVNWAVFSVVLDVLTLLLVDSPFNCAHFLKSGGAPDNLLPFVEAQPTRTAALKVLHLLLMHVPEKNGAVVTALLGLLRDTKGDREIASETLMVLAQLMGNRWPVKEAFRDTGGFVCVMSLLMTLEGAFGLAVAAKEADCALLVTLFDTCTAAVAGHADNRSFFCSDILPSVVGALKLTGVLVTGREARMMLLALFRLLTENRDCLSGMDASGEHRRYCTVKIGPVALVLLELMECLNDENKFYLLECLLEMVQGLSNKEVFARQQVLGLVLRLFEDLLCRPPNKLVDRLLDFVVQIGSFSISQSETIQLFRLLRRHGYPSHLLRAMRCMCEASRTPSLIEFNMASPVGFACLKMLPGTVHVAQGYSWPSPNGWTMLFWMCVEDFGQAPVVVCSLSGAVPGSDEVTVVTRISVSSAGVMSFSSLGKSVDFVGFKMEPRQWYHVAVCWQKRRFSSPEACLYIDGAVAWIGTVPQFNYVNVDQLSIVCGTPQEEKLSASKQLWWLGPLYLLDDHLDAKVVLTLFTLGPSYCYNLQGRLDQFQVPGAVNSRSLDLVAKYQFPSPIGCLDLALAQVSVPEERLVVAVHARSVQVVPGTDSRVLKNASPNRPPAAKAERAFGDVLLLGGVKAFGCNGLPHMLHAVGGVSALLVACAEAQDSFLDALRLTVAVIQASWRNARVLDASVESSYDVLAHALALQTHRLSGDAMDILWELVGLPMPAATAAAAATFASPVRVSARSRDAPSSGVLANVGAFSALFLSFVPWKSSGLRLQVKVFEDMASLIRGNKHTAFNMWMLLRVNTIPRILAVLSDENVPFELYPAVTELFALMIRLQPVAVMEQLTLFLLSTVPVTVADAKSASVGTGLTTRRRGLTGLSQSDNDVMRIVSLRNMLLEMLHAEIIHSPTTYEALVTTEWLSHWTSRQLHTSSRLIGLRMLTTMLSCSPSFSKSFQRSGWKWLLESMSTFQMHDQVVYLLVAILYGLPASSVPTKVRADMCDLHTLFPPDKSPVVNPEVFVCLLSILKTSGEAVFDALSKASSVSSKSATFVPIKPRAASDSDYDSDKEAEEALRSSKASVPVAPVPSTSRGAVLRPSSENLMDRNSERQPDLSALSVMCKYLVQAFETNETFRVLFAVDSVLDRIVGLMFVRNHVNMLFSEVPVHGMSGAALFSLSRDKATYGGLHKLGRDELQILSVMLHFWVRNDPKVEQKTLDLLACVAPEIVGAEANLFILQLINDVMIKLRQNVTLKDLETSPKVVEGIFRFTTMACDLVGMGLFPGGERMVWECVIELFERGEPVLNEALKGGLLTRFGKTKLTALYRPLNRAALALLARDDTKRWIVGRIIYHQRFVLNHANDDKPFLHGLVHFLTGFVLSDDRELRDGSMAVLKLLLIVWEGVMKEILVVPPPRSGVAGLDALNNGFDKLLQGVMGFQDWLSTKMELVVAVLNETASKWWGKAHAQDVKAMQDALKAFRAKQQRTSSKRAERDNEGRLIDIEFEAARRVQQERCRVEWIVPRKRERTAMQERQHIAALMWQKTLWTLESERGIWGPEESQWDKQRWKLAFVEGAYHMRLRLEENTDFWLPRELLMSTSRVPSPTRRMSSSPDPFSDKSTSASKATYDEGTDDSTVPTTPVVARSESAGFVTVKSPRFSAFEPDSPTRARLTFGNKKKIAHSDDSMGSSDDSSLSLSPHAMLAFTPDKNDDSDAAAAAAEDEAAQAERRDKDEDAKLDRLQRFLEGDDRVHFRSSFNVGRIQGMTKTPAILLICQGSVYVVDDFQVDFEQQEIVDVERPLRAKSSHPSSGSSSRSSSPANVGGSDVGPGGMVRKRTTSFAQTQRDGHRTVLLGHDSRRWSYLEIVDLQQKRYLLQNIAIELYSADGRNELLSFATRKDKNDAWKQLNRAWASQKARLSVDEAPVALAPGTAAAAAAAAAANASAGAGGWRKMSMMVLGPGTVSLEDNMTHRWRHGDVSNFEYLMFLNGCAGRSYNDLTQYPVFPWILADYDSAVLDLSSPAAYRNLSKPMGAQTDDRASAVRQRFEDYDPAEHDVPAFHYGTHYSSAAAVLYYLIRQEPFTSQFLWELQGGHFDHADRTFSSIAGTWKSAAGLTNSTSDVKELIPEFFLTSEFLRNSNRLNLGARTNGGIIDDVELPPWAGGDHALFVQVNRMALESEYVSQHLHEWIDLIFGFKQRGAEAVTALNVFHFLSYEGEVNVDDIEDPLQRKATLDAIFNFGQTPRQLFFKPHAPRLVTEAFKGGLEHPFARIKNAARANLSFELLGEVGFPVRKLQSRGGSTIGVCRPLQAFAGARLVRCDGPDQSVRLLAAGGATMDALEGLHDGPVAALACCGGEHVVTGGVDGVVAVCRVGSRKNSGGACLELQRRLAHGQHRAAITAVAVSSVWNILVTAAADQSVVLWDLRSHKMVRSLSAAAAGASRKASSAVTCIAVDEKNGNVATASPAALTLFTVNGEPLASLSLASVAPAECVCFVEAHFSVLGAVTLVTSHQCGTVRLFRLDSSNARNVRWAADSAPEPPPNPSPLRFFLTEVYVYAAHTAPVTALLMTADGLVSADDTGKVVRAFAKDANAEPQEYILKPTE